jgi:hypothetical protein
MIYGISHLRLNKNPWLSTKNPLLKKSFPSGTAASYGTPPCHPAPPNASPHEAVELPKHSPDRTNDPRLGEITEITM